MAEFASNLLVTPAKSYKSKRSIPGFRWQSHPIADPRLVRSRRRARLAEHVTCRNLSRSTVELTRSNRSRWLAEQVWLGRHLYALRVQLSGNGLNSLGPALLSRCVNICLITTGSSMLRSDVSAMILTAPPHASQVDTFFWVYPGFPKVFYQKSCVATT